MKSHEFQEDPVKPRHSVLLRAELYPDTPNASL